MSTFHPDRDAAYFNRVGQGHFPGHLDIHISLVEANRVVAEMPIRPEYFAPNGFLHAGSIVTLADTVAGYATIAHLPENGKSFTTLELKTSFLKAAREGMLICEGTPEHLGRTTQVWRVEARRQSDQKTVALFQCTQLILY